MLNVEPWIIIDPQSRSEPPVLFARLYLSPEVDIYGSINVSSLSAKYVAIIGQDVDVSVYK